MILHYIFLAVMSAACGALVHSISRMMLGKQANGYPAAIVILAAAVSPWWVAGIGGAAGHLISVWVWNRLSDRAKRAAH